MEKNGEGALMKATSIMIAIFCLNLAAYSVHLMGIFPVTKELWINPTDITNQFTLTLFAVVGGGGIIVGILAAIFKTYTFAAGAILLWVVSIFLPIVQWIVGGFPIMMAAVLPAELAWFTVVAGAFIAVSFFFFLAEIAAGRQLQ